MKNLGTLYKFELGKILRRRIAGVTVGISLLLILGTLAVDSLGDFYIDGVKVDTNFHMNQIYKADQQKLDGRLIDQELLEEMSNGYGKIPEEAINGVVHYIGTEEYQTYARPYSAIFNFVRSAGMMTISEAMEWEADEQELYQRRQQSLEEYWQEYFLTEKEKDFWREQDDKLEWPITYRFKEGYWHLLQSTYTVGLLILLATVICLAGVFSEEHNRKTDQLILSSKYGREPVYLAKLLAGISFTVGFNALVFGMVILETYFLYGLEGFGATFQLIMPGFSYSLNVGESVLLVFCMTMLAAVLTGVFVMLLSELFQNSLGTLALTVGLIIFCMAVSSLPACYRVLSQAWSYLPSNFIAAWSIFDYRTVPVFGKMLLSWQAVPILYFILGGVFAVIGKRRYVNCQVRGR